MRKISTGEMLQLTSLLSMETIGVANTKATRELAQDDELRRQLDSFIQAGEARIKGIQQFINENDIVSEVH